MVTMLSESWATARGRKYLFRNNWRSSKANINVILKFGYLK